MGMAGRPFVQFRPDMPRDTTRAKPRVSIDRGSSGLVSSVMCYVFLQSFPPCGEDDDTIAPFDSDIYGLFPPMDDVGYIACIFVMRRDDFLDYADFVQ